jgi:hypothetical protein
VSAETTGQLDSGRLDDGIGPLDMPWASRRCRRETRRRTGPTMPQVLVALPGCSGRRDPRLTVEANQPLIGSINYSSRAGVNQPAGGP